LIARLLDCSIGLTPNQSPITNLQSPINYPLTRLPNYPIPSPPSSWLDLATAGRPWTVGLKSRDGAWLSIAAGWFTGARAVMFFQLNDDRDHEDASLSVVLRGLLIETLIRRGIPELVFWSGCAAPLSRYVEPIPAMAAYLDTPALGWRLIRSMIGKTHPWMPGWMAADLRWIANDGVLSPEPPEAPIADGVAAIEDAMFSGTRPAGER